MPLSGGLSTTAKARVQQWPTIVNRYFSSFKLASNKDIGQGASTERGELRDFSGRSLCTFQIFTR